jgi:hypothetical protein
MASRPVNRFLHRIPTPSASRPIERPSVLHVLFG